jgi:hypothetical protein
MYGNYELNKRFAGFSERKRNAIAHKRWEVADKLAAYAESNGFDVVRNMEDPQGTIRPDMGSIAVCFDRPDYYIAYNVAFRLESTDTSYFLMEVMELRHGDVITTGYYSDAEGFGWVFDAILENESKTAVAAS